MAAIPDISFTNPLALIALLSIIPLIILYLLRPRAVRLKVPSLIFFLQREQQRSKLSLLLRKLIKDPVFFIQLLVLTLLSFSMAAPYFMQEEVSSQHTVIVIDNSASMQAGGRLGIAKELSAGRLSAINSIIWAQNVPVLALKEAGSAEAKKMIALTPQRAVSSDLAAAIKFAERLTGPGGNIIVFSDFASWTGDDPLVAKGLAEYNGVRVEFVQIGKIEENIGFTSGWLENRNGSLYLNLAVGNYNDKAVTAAIKIQTGSEVRGGSLSIPARSTRAFIVPDLVTGVTRVSLENGGAMEIDDTAYAYVPTAAEGGILLVDTRPQTPIAAALALLPVTFEHSTTLPADLSRYGILILGDVNYSAQSPDPTTALSRFVENGGALIATASPHLAQLKGGLLPVNIEGISNETELKLISDSPPVKGIPITEVEVVKHLAGSVPKGAAVLVEASDGAPMLSSWRLGDGMAVYLGFNDITGDEAWSGFNTMPEFPLFWDNMLHWLGGTDPAENNIRTGTVMRLPSKQSITYPDGTKADTSNLWIDQAGIYRIGEQFAAANLYDPKESDEGTFSLDAASITSKFVERPDIIRTDVIKDLTPYLIWAILGLVLLELVFVFRRGELF